MKTKGGCIEFETGMRRRNFVRKFGIILCAVSLGVFPFKAAAKNVIKWKYYQITPPLHHDSITFKEFTKEVERLTNGQLQITAHTGGELPYRPNEAVNIVRDRFVDGGTAVGDFVAGSIPMLNLTNLPMLVTSERELSKAMEVFEPYVEKEFNTRGTRILFWHFNSMKCIFGRGKPIENLDDIKGKKIRTFGVPDSQFIKRLGGTPVSMPNTEVPTAMQRGVMDAFIASAFFTLGCKWDELCDWGYLFDMSAIMSFEILSIASVKELSDANSKILFDTAAKYHTRWHKDILDLEKKARIIMANKGKRMIEITEKDRASSTEIIKPYWQEWADSVGSDAPEALQKVRDVLGK